VKFNIQNVLAHLQVSKKLANMSFPRITKSNLKVFLQHTATSAKSAKQKRSQASVSCYDVLPP
jgi:hypothetical protein